MGKNRAVILLFLSLLISAVAIWAAVQWVNGQVEKRSTPHAVKLVVASINVVAGGRLGPEQLKVVDWPAENPISGSFSETQPLLNRIVNVNLSAGEPVIEQKLAPVGSKAGLSALITPGMRAVSVRVNDVAGVSGFALPGNHVDVMVNVQDDQGRMVSKIVLQQIMVLAVAQDASVKDDVKAKVVNTVTLEVTPQQAEKLDLARSVGNLSLVLLNQVDQTPVVTYGVRKAELLDQDGKAPPKQLPSGPGASGQSTGTIEVIRGTARATVSSH
ncbi:MAG: Flp pilus assembly protein CpaB [Burkholderiales bacterium]|nr:Flp pilus assembly protein CpaB [Ferrovum sp.]